MRARAIPPFSATARDSPTFGVWPPPARSEINAEGGRTKSSIELPERRQYHEGVKILVLGSGAREHAIIKSLVSESVRHEITAAPGNAGIAADVATVAIDADDPVAVTNFAIEHDTELVIIGPEAPLVAGVADALRTHGIPVFGPGQAAAQLEGSKAFAKHIMEKAGVPTGHSVRAATLLEAEAALDAFGSPYVVKADGLAAGKGVLVTEDREEAVAHATFWLEHGSVLVEEFLQGPEVSLFLLSDGRSVLPLAPAQDFKRLGDGDTGPNTGGMGAYSPLPWLPDDFVDEVVRTIALPTVHQLAVEQTPFIGLLYCGLIVTPEGTRVIEFNARFGDPETQVVLPRLVTPLSGLLLAAATGALADEPRPEFALDVAVAVVLASEGYPAAPVTGRRIGGLDAAAAVPEVQILHAATEVSTETADATSSWTTESLVATGGRVLNVVALGTTFDEARASAYEAIGRIHLEGAQFRTDIALRANHPQVP
jgi:phosphoribosylamine--glycine ligase